MKLHRFGVLGFVVLVLAALFNLAALYTAERSFDDLQETLSGIRRSQQAQNLVERLYRLLVDAETAQRGYLLTGDRTYLTPYQDAVHQSSPLIADNPVQVAQLATVTSLLKARFAQIEQSVAMKRDSDENAIREFIASGAG